MLLEGQKQPGQLEQREEKERAVVDDIGEGHCQRPHLGTILRAMESHLRVFSSECFGKITLAAL